jgi:hypothetical protein
MSLKCGAHSAPAVIVAVLYLALGALMRGGRAAWSTPLSKCGVARALSRLSFLSQPWRLPSVHFTIVTTIAVLLAGRRFEALLLAASVMSSAIVVYAVKTISGRARPPHASAHAYPWR